MIKSSECRNRVFNSSVLLPGIDRFNLITETQKLLLLFLKSIPIFSILFIFSCDKISVFGENQHESAPCQYCHQSPPPTGEHFFHVYTQTKREQITCIECHAGSIEKMLWKPTVSRKRIRDMRGFQTQIVVDSILTLESTPVYNITKSGCEVELRTDSVFKADFDTISSVVLTLGTYDSISINDISYVYFEYIRTQKLNDTDKVNIFKNPVVYDKCSYSYSSGKIWVRNLGPKNILLFVADSLNQLTVDEEKRELHYWYTNYNYIDTAIFKLVKVEETFIGELPIEERSNYVSVIKGDSLVLEYISGNEHWDLKVEEIVYQIRNDSLYRLFADSIVTYGDETFASHTSLHGDGKVDVKFKHEEYTYFVEETVDVKIHNITGEKTGGGIRVIGSWDPKKRTCYTAGVSNQNCHNNLAPSETFWYTDEIPEFYIPIYKE